MWHSLRLDSYQTAILHHIVWYLLIDFQNVCYFSNQIWWTTFIYFDFLVKISWNRYFVQTIKRTCQVTSTKLPLLEFQSQVLCALYSVFPGSVLIDLKVFLPSLSYHFLAQWAPWMPNSRYPLLNVWLRSQKCRWGQALNDEQCNLISPSKAAYLAFEPSLLDTAGAQANARSFENAALQASSSKVVKRQYCLRFAAKRLTNYQGGVWKTLYGWDWEARKEPFGWYRTCRD